MSTVFIVDITLRVMGLVSENNWSIQSGRARLRHRARRNRQFLRKVSARSRSHRRKSARHALRRARRRHRLEHVRMRLQIDECSRRGIRAVRPIRRERERRPAGLEVTPARHVARVGDGMGAAVLEDQAGRSLLTMPERRRTMMALTAWSAADATSKSGERLRPTDARHCQPNSRRDAEASQQFADHAERHE